MRSLSLLAAAAALVALVPASRAFIPVPTAKVSKAGSLSLSVQLGNKYTHASDRSIHALVRLEAAKAKGQKQRPVNMALVIDRSGSMRGNKIADARHAAIGMIDKLRDGDRVAIVSYSTDVVVDVPSTIVDRSSRERLKAAIHRIGPSGSTFLSGGLVKGQEQVRKHLDSDKVNRVLLISDGLANVGVTSIPDLNRIAREASQDGIVTTTLGLGTDYNEDLMTAVADNGGGNYYYVRESTELAGVLAQELGQMMATVAQRSTLELTVPKGVEVVEVYGYAWQKEGPTVIVRLGDMFAGQKRAVLWKLKVAEDGGRQDLGAMTLHYADANDGARKSAKQPMTVSVTRDGALVESNKDQAVAARIAEIELATSVQKAAELVQTGDYQQARQVLQRATRKAKDRGRTLGKAGAGLVFEASEAEALADELQAAPATAADKRDFVKKSKAAGYKMKKK